MQKDKNKTHKKTKTNKKTKTKKNQVLQLFVKLNNLNLKAKTLFTTKDFDPPREIEY